MNTALDDNRVVIIETDNPDYAQHGYGAFYIKDRSLVFCTDDNKDVEMPAGKKAVIAQEYFTRTILRDAVCSLDAYLRKRMDDFSMYENEKFWQDALKHAGRTIVPNALWIDYRGVPYGYLILHTGDGEKSLCYSYVDGATVPQGDGDKFAATAVELCYHGLSDQMLAQRHAGAGTAPEAYTAIAEMNGFLKNKRSVYAVWPDGTARQSLEHRPLTAANLLCIRHGRFEANTSGYRDTPRSGEGLPAGLRHDSVEYRLLGMGLERLELTSPGAGASNSQGQSHLIAKIAGMIPSGTWLPFCKIKLTTAQGHADTILHPSSPDTRDDLIKLDGVKKFLHKHGKKSGLKATVVKYCIGTGGPGDMPAEVFSLLEQLGYWQWQQIPGFGEGSPRTIDFDAGFLKDFLNDNSYEETPADRDATNLMPPSVKRKLKANKLYSKDGQGKKAEVVVKYFNPSGSGTWLITEGEEQDDGDWLLFGMCHIFEWEWGYVQLSELQSAKAPPFGLGIERDLYFSGTVEELMEG